MLESNLPRHNKTDSRESAAANADCQTAPVEHTAKTTGDGRWRERKQLSVPQGGDSVMSCLDKQTVVTIKQSLPFVFAPLSLI